MRFRPSNFLLPASHLSHRPVARALRTWLNRRCVVVSQGQRWQERLIDVANGFDTLFDHVARAASARRGPDTRPLHIVPYRGFGTAAGLVVRGRVLREYDVRPPRAGDGTLRNVLNMYRRFGSDEVPWARVAVRATGSAHEAARVAVADNEGFFEAVLPYPAGSPSGPPGAPAPLWRPVDLNLPAPPTVGRYAGVRQRGGPGAPARGAAGGDQRHR